jgi:hypothetical protein
LGGVFAEEAEEEAAVVIGIEDELTAEAALGDVVGLVGVDDAWAAGHTYR